MALGILVSMLLASVPVNAAVPAPRTISGLVKRLGDEQVAPFYKTDTADNLGLERGMPSRELVVAADDTEDGMKHMVDLVLKDDKPMCLVFAAKKTEADHFDLHLLRTDLSGHLERAILGIGKYDEQGKPIKGAGIIKPLDIKAKGTKSALRHELDFWLKGMYRKPAAPSQGSPQ